MKIQRAIYIYFSGYSTHSDYTLEEWFEARDRVKTNKRDVMDVIEKKEK